MKILQIIPYFFLSWANGNPVGLISELSKSLVDRGHDVTIYTTDAFNKNYSLKYNKTNFLDGVQVCEFRAIGNKLGTDHHICISLGMIPALSKTLHIFDIIHLHEYRTFQNIVTHHYAKKKHVPYVLHAHGSLPMMGKKNMKCVYDALWGHQLLRDAEKVIAVTPMEAQQYKDMGLRADKIEVIPHAIDIVKFEHLPKIGEFRRKYGLSDNQRIILSLGRIHKVKGLDLLVRAFADLSKELSDVKLVIAGPDDGYRSELKELIKELSIEEKTLIVGPLYGRDKLEAYVDAGVYVLPSYYEIFSVTVLEACASGTPVIVTDSCGIANVIDGQAGLVVPCDKDQLREALIFILDNIEVRERFAMGGKKLVSEQFNWSKVVGQLEDVYQECISSQVKR